MNHLLLLFQSTHSVIRAERLCLAENYPCKVIPVPRQISSECGIAIELKEGQEQAIQDLLTNNSIPFKLHRLT